MTLFKQQGFSLLEVATATTLMGILATTAFPRILDLKDDAQSSVFKSLASSIHNAAEYAHLKQIALGLGEHHSVQLSNQSIAMTHAYPSEKSIALLLNTSDHFKFDETNGTFYWLSKEHENCHVRYQAPAQHNSLPTITVADIDCHKLESNLASL